MSIRARGSDRTVSLETIWEQNEEKVGVMVCCVDNLVDGTNYKLQQFPDTGN